VNPLARQLCCQRGQSVTITPVATRRTLGWITHSCRSVTLTLVQVSQVLLRCEIEKEAVAVVVRP